MDNKIIDAIKKSNLLEKLINANVIKYQNGEYLLSTKYYVGTIELKHKFALLHIEDEPDLTPHIEFEELNGAYGGDLVIAKKIFHPRAKNKIKVEFILSKSHSTLLVYKKNFTLWSLKESLFIKYSYEIEDLKELDVALIDTSTNKIVKYIGNLKDPYVDEEISLILYQEDYRLDFNNFEELQYHIPTDTQNRVDLRDLNFCTIDPDSAKDFDDAIYFDEKNFTLFVAIADVSSFVLPNSDIDQEAKRRAFSLYLPHKVLPMLPHKLSSDLCSLMPDQDRLAFVFEIKLDPISLKIINTKLYEAIINSKKRFTYGRIDRVLQGKFDTYTPLEKELFENLIKLHKLSQRLKSKRLEKGFDFLTKEASLKLDKVYELQSVQIEDSTPSHSLIEECMLLANISAAKMLDKRGIFRVHDEPNEKAIKYLLSDLSLLGIDVREGKNIHETILLIQKEAKRLSLSSEVDDLIIKAQQQASYSPMVSKHFGLGFNKYSHFTSPIRRYSDLVLHRILKTKEVPYDIALICENISQKERTIDKCVWDFEDRKYARWALKHKGMRFEGEIVDIEKKIAVLTTGAYGARVKFDTYENQKLFSKIYLQILDADIASKEIFATITKY